MDGMRKSYRPQHVETHALTNFTISNQDGEFVSVMGPSGSGKTTLLNIAGLLDTFEHGSYLLDGEDVSRLSDREMSAIRNQKIGFIFQSYNLIPVLTAAENAEFTLMLQTVSKAKRRQRVQKLFADLGIDGL